MTRDINDVDEQRLSRRAALKGLGAAGAVAWAVPTVLSTSAASAATVVPHPCTSADCGPNDCFDQSGCGTDSITTLPCSCTQNFPLGNGCTCTCCAAAGTEIPIPVASVKYAATHSGHLGSRASTVVGSIQPRQQIGSA